jgi:pyruvate dehydrogenase E1 component alpha subunit
MPSEPVDGMSCEAVHEALERTADLARKGNGPYFLELKTYRYRGHSMSDPAKYRSKEELESYKNVDPIEVVKASVIKNKWLSNAEVEAMEEEIENEVDHAVEFADNSPFPDPDELYKDVYMEEYPFIIE